jgi:hypothetical protein
LCIAFLMDSRINADYSHHRTIEEHFDMSAEEMYADSKLAAILLEDNNSFATDDSYPFDANDVCE